MATKVRPDSMEALLKALKNPFDPKLVKFRVGATSKDKSKGIALAYIDARDVEKRLDDVVGNMNWKKVLKPIDNGFICGIAIKWQDEWVSKDNAAGYTKVEPVKGGASDAFKRAAVDWGIGRYLYYLPQTWVSLEGSSFGLPFNTVQELRNSLPNWALPDSNIENWEDIAEMEAESNSGMDDLEMEYIADVALANGDKILNAKTTDELNEAWDSLSEEEQGIMAKAYSKRLSELNAAN